MLRRVAVPAVTAAAVAGGSRSLWTTHQSSQLAATKSERGYKSDLWVSAQDDGWWYNKHTSLKSNAAPPVRAALPKRLELINGSQLKTPLDGEEPVEHSSASTKKPYKGQTLKELQQRALLNDYTSKWWITPNQARQRNLQLLPRNRAHAILLRVPVEVYNIEELTDASKVATHPISAESGRPVFGDVGLPLEMAVAERGYSTGIFFREGALGDFSTVGVALKEGATGVETTSTEVNTLYNIEDFENQTAIRALAPADYSPDPAQPRYLTTGTSMTQANVVTALRESGYKESLWMSLKDLQFKQTRDPETFRLKPGAAGVELPAYSGMWYNADEMTDPIAALRAVGTMTR